jgi:hypothetical protein
MSNAAQPNGGGPIEKLPRRRRRRSQSPPAAPPPPRQRGWVKRSPPQTQAPLLHPTQNNTPPRPLCVDKADLIPPCSLCDSVSSSASSFCLCIPTTASACRLSSPSSCGKLDGHARQPSPQDTKHTRTDHPPPSFPHLPSCACHPATSCASAPSPRYHSATPLTAPARTRVPVCPITAHVAHHQPPYGPVSQLSLYQPTHTPHL